MIDGEKRVVLGAPMADKLVVSARTSGKPADAKGISLFLVDREAAGVSLRPYATVDETRAADVPGITAVEVTMTWEPPWSPDRMTDDAKTQLGVAW